MNAALSAAGAAASKPLNVAIVDDDESVRRSLTQLLRAAGVSTRTYASAELFLEYATQALIDCLVLDIQLGGMSGFDLHRQLALRDMALPIVFITAHDSPRAREQARLADHAAYLSKPFTGKTLMAAIDQVTSRYPEDRHRLGA